MNLIYGLIDPRTRMVRYIGKSTSGLKRPAQHRHKHGRDTRTYCAYWVQSLQKLGLDYDIVVLDVADAATLSMLECWWIAYGRASGWPLTNLTTGGEGASGAKHSSATRAKLRIIKLNQSAETRAKIGAANSKRVWSAESRQKASSRKLGTVHSPELRVKMGLAIKTSKASPEARQAISDRARAAAFKRGLQPCGTRACYRRGCRCRLCVDATRRHYRITDARRAK